METRVLVHVDLESVPVLAGTLWARTRKGKESASFEYDEGWLAHPGRFSLEPALTLGTGPFHTPAGRPLFGALGDSAPDRWGRLLIRRAERRRAERAGETPRTLSEIDYLIRVDDEAHQGALRFAEAARGPFLTSQGATRIPPLVELPRLLSAAERVLGDSESEEDLRLLLAPGSSLGGARPKASVRDRDGSLAIAKFPHRDDEVDAVRWEATALALAEKAGLAVPARRLEVAAGRPVLLLRRFDRRGVERVLLDIREGASLNYLRAVQPEYPLSKAVRTQLGDFPLDLRKCGNAQAAWAAAEKDPRARFNFLVNYACEYADFVQPFDMLRQTKVPPKSRKGCAEWTGTLYIPEVLSAFPDQTDAGWIAVEGTLAGTRPGEPGEHKGYLDVRGAAPHTVSFFVWLESAKPHLERFSDNGWSASVRGLDDGYPFDLWKRVSTDPHKDHRVRVVGRFLRNRFGYPRNWLEVWEYQVGLSATQERMLRALEDPVDISLPEMELQRAAEILRDWFDLHVGLGPADPSTRIQATAAECPKGLLVDAFAKSALGMDWYWKDGQVVLCAAGRSPMSSDVAAVLERLKAPPLSTAATKVSAAPSNWTGVTPKAERKAEPKGDVATLRRAAGEEIRRMEYGEADRFLEKVLAAASTAKDRTTIERSRAKVQIFDELTRRTPVSKLAAAKELTEVAYRKGTKEVIRRTVILTRTKDSKGKDVWWVQEAYGAKLRIQPEQIESMQPIPVEESRKGRLAQLDSKTAECSQASGVSKALKLVLLALFAKTSGLSDRGTSFLSQAFEMPEFEDVLAQLCPRRSEDLVALWRTASGRVAEKPPVPPVDPTPPRPETTAGVATAPAGKVAPLPDGLSAGELLVHARRYAEAGSACARKVMEGDDAGPWRKTALENFEQAKVAIGKYLDRDPDDSFGKRLQTQVTAMMDTLRKDMGFFEG